MDGLDPAAVTPGDNPLNAPFGTKMDARAEYASLPVEDDFSDERRPGKVIGTQSTSGAVRLGCDLEKLVANNRGALRFQPLIDAGWARQGIAYGPFRRENGLVMAVSINNGHNTSHATGNPDSFARRVFRWAKGPNADPWHVRAFSWMRAPRKMNTLRRLYWWWRISPGVFDRPELNENLALGWFTSEAPADPVNDGCGFVVHAAEAENGELWARVGDRCLPAFRRLMNLQVTYVVALRERGAVYYVSSSEGAHGMAAFPEMRPVAIDPFNADETLYASVHQSALGQIGFRVDTRLHGVRIEKSPEFMTPFGTAHAADRLTGAGPLAGDAEVGPAWRILEGRVDRTTDGASAAGKALAVIDPAMPSGLVHVMVRAAEASAGGGLIWRMAAEDSYWLLRFSPGGFDLLQVRDGRETVVASDVKRPLTPDRFHSLQILDSHGQIGCYLDGEQLFDGWIEDGLFDDASGVGILLDGRSVTMRDFEAHPRSVPIPREFRFEPPWNRMGERIVYRDDFAGTPGEAQVVEGTLAQVGLDHFRRSPFGSKNTGLSATTQGTTLPSARGAKMVLPLRARPPLTSARAMERPQFGDQ